MIVKKFIYFLLVLLLIPGLLITGCKKDLTKGKSPKDIIVESGKAMQSIKTYKMGMDFTMELPKTEGNPVSSISMKGEGYTNIDPLGAKLDFTIQMGQMSMPMGLYLSTENDKLIEYVSNPMVENQWMKLEIPLDENMKKLMDPKQSLQITEDSIKDAKLVGDDKIDDVEYAIIEVIVDSSLIKDFMNLSSQTNPMSQQMFDQIATALDNLSYKVWVRKDNLYQAKLTIDMGEVMQKMFATLAPKDVPQEELDALKEIKGTMTMTFSDFGKAVDITVPDDIKNSAQDMTQLMQDAQPEPQPQPKIEKK